MRTITSGSVSRWKRFPLVLTGIVLMFFVTAVAQESQSPAPPLPANIPPEAVVHSQLIFGNLAGQEAVWKDAEGVIHIFYQFNDRGRGPKLDAEYRLDKSGVPVSVAIKGNDYLKSPVEEQFTLKDGAAQWKNPSEDAQQAGATGKFYSAIYGPPEELAMMVRAALAHGGQLDLLPAGAIRAEQAGGLEIAGPTPLKVTMYAVHGLDLSPSIIWLDDKQQFFAAGSTWAMMIRQGHEAGARSLIEIQSAYEQARAKALVPKATQRPTGDLVIKNVSVFDVESGKVRRNRTVTVRGERIVSVSAPAAKGAMVIDGTGKMLLPGLWDMHAHVTGNDPLLDIAAGVTTARDLANDETTLLALRQRIDRLEEIGPRIIAAGFIDGPGPYQGPTKILAGTAEEALGFVRHYHDSGYPQIKMYSSLKPGLVPVVIGEAHKLGMRVSGHIPAGMTAEECVRLGQDEIQHMNMIFLNFMPDVKETRTPARFIEPGLRGGDLDLGSKPVLDFVTLLREKHVVVDPTMTAWEGTYLDRPGATSATFAAVAGRLPAQTQRGLRAGGGLPVTPESDAKYRKSYAKMVQMLKVLYDGGVQLVPGTDNFAGFAYHRELEIYQSAGIPAARVLRMATLDSARVMNKDKDLGSIAPGKLADMILVDGDPTQNISDIRKVRTVIKDGVVYAPAEIYRFLGITPVQ
ncbi:MAG: amidohydrolase family protein [Acidobacteriales bacterium]|nr:amidohydrolase family protein [Terriglobales bacterium]